MQTILVILQTYCAIKWTKPEQPDGTIYKGLKVVRRDTCELVRRTSRMVIDQLLVEKDTDKAISSVRTTIKQLLRGEFDIDDLLVSQSLKRPEEYKVEHLPHQHVVALMDRRMPGSAPKPGTTFMSA